MEIILGIIFLLICCVIAFLVTYWLPILLGILTAIIITAVIYSIYDKARKKKISRVVKARIISREPITRREKEVTGHQENPYYYPYWYSEYYRYVDVIVGYRVKFSVEYKDGTRDIIACIEGDYTYNKLSAIPNRWDMGKFIDPIKRIPDAQNKAPGKVEITYADGTSKVFEFDDDDIFDDDSAKDNTFDDIAEDKSEAPKEQHQAKKERFAVIDFETTGLNYNFRRPPMDEIISVAIIDQDGKTLLDTLCDTVNVKTWYEAQQVNGISPRMVRGYPTFVDIMPKVIEILSSYDYVIAYNVPFEKSFLENYVRLYTPTDFSIHKVQWGEDPMAMFMDHMNSKRFLKLESAAEHFGYTYHALNALEDTKATLFVYNALRKR